jgi:hypothetical protein
MVLLQEQARATTGSFLCISSRSHLPSHLFDNANGDNTSTQEDYGEGLVIDEILQKYKPSSPFVPHYVTFPLDEINQPMVPFCFGLLRFVEYVIQYQGNFHSAMEPLAPAIAKAFAITVKGLQLF